MSPHSLLLLIGALLISPALSLKCTSQTFKAHYENCTDLPALKAFLHWTFNETKSTLSVAFIAPPAAEGGWIGWGINPTAAGMVGAQTFIAFSDPQGKVAVKTYNLSSYSAIMQQKLSIKVLDSKAEAEGGVMRIFATVELPKDAAAKPLNQVWQVGAFVKDGMPQKHEFSPENLAAKATLKLPAGKSAAAGAPVLAPAAAPAPGDAPKNATAPSADQKSGDSSRNLKIDMNICVLFSAILAFGLIL